MWQLFIITFSLLNNQIQSSLMGFDQAWSILDRSDPKKSKTKQPFYPFWPLSVNVTTFYSNIFRLVRRSKLIKFGQIWTIFDGSDPKMKRPFLFFLKIWQLFILMLFDAASIRKLFLQKDKTDRQTKTETRTDVVAQLVV